jgi:cytochrome c2
MGLSKSILATAMALCIASPSWARENGDAQRGLSYAKANCGECHAVLATEVVSPRRGVATFKAIADTPGMTGTALAVWLQTPHKSMPNLIIPPDDRADVIAYVLSLRDQRTSR